jgi:hypothetical protein
MNVSVPIRLFRWDGRNLYCGNLWVGEVISPSAGPRAGQWRAWVTTEPPGAHHGWYVSETEARRQVEAIARAALPPLGTLAKR